MIWEHFTNIKAHDEYVFRRLVLQLLATGLPGGLYAQTLTDIGASAPTPGANDISQLSTSGDTTSPDGLNYYTDNSSPAGQTFTTGTSTKELWAARNHQWHSAVSPSQPPGRCAPTLIPFSGCCTPSTTGPTVLSTVNHTLTLQFTRLTPAPVSYTVESSMDLSTWTTIATLPMASDTWTGSASVAETGIGATRATTVTDTQTMASGPRRFLRLRVNINEPTP